MFTQKIDGEVEESEQRAEEDASTGETLQSGVMAFDIRLDVLESAGLSVADDGLHLGLEHGEVFKDALFEISHGVSLVSSFVFQVVKVSRLQGFKVKTKSKTNTWG